MMLLLKCLTKNSLAVSEKNDILLGINLEGE